MKKVWLRLPAEIIKKIALLASIRDEMPSDTMRDLILKGLDHISVNEKALLLAGSQHG